MRIKTKEVRDGKHVGEKVWICHYHRPDEQKKPLRNIPPTEVVVVDNDELPKNKKVYYSESHFRPLNKKGAVMSRIISPVDNTGFRMRCGNELFVFTTEQECISEWNEQIMQHMTALDPIIKSAAQRWQNEKDALGKMLQPSAC